MIIAIDGPAAAGKGTLARRLAEYFDLAYLDTGLLYRAVGRKVLDAGVDLSGDPENYRKAATDAAINLTPADLEVDGLRNDETAQAASRVSAIEAVRAALLDFQRDFAANPPRGTGGAVLDGRDITTVVCPDADVRLFVSADVEVRARRRLKELRERGLESIHSRVLQDMKERDARDSSRDVAPLVAAEGAFVLDTSEMDADKVFATVLDHIKKRS